jgi:Ni,Fe-hydrogenase III component G
MNTAIALTTAAQLLSGLSAETSTPESDRLDVTIDSARLLAAITVISDARWGYLVGITGLDLGPEAGVIEVLYHFCQRAAVLTLRVRTPRDKCAVPSISKIIPPAVFYERELREMLNVTVDGLENADHLFLPDDWPDGVYPLRKDALLK